MKKKILLILSAALFFLMAQAQTVTIEIEESDGGCGQASDCETNIACFNLIITVDEPDWALSSYNVWTQYPAPPVMSYFSDDACITQNGGDTDDNLNGQYRVAGVTGTGTYVLEPNTPTIFHNVCYSYSDELDIQDSVIAAGGTLLVYGTPFFTTVTLVNQITNLTAGLTIPQQEFLTLDGATFTCLKPDLTIEKVLTSNADNDASGTISLGDVLTYTITATNTGFIPQENVVVSDPILTPNQTTCATLEVGETCVLVGTYVVTEDDVDAGEIVNTGTVVSDNAGPVTDELITPVPNMPDMTIEKTLLTDISGGVSVGDVLAYQVEVVNTGDMTLNNVVINDTKITPGSTTCSMLSPGSSCTLIGVYFVKQSDMNSGEIINTATAESDEVPEIADELITTLPDFPQITVEKVLLTDISGGVEVGDVLVYNVEVLNSGNVTLTNVTAIDPMLTPGVKVCPALDPGMVCSLTGTYVVQQSDVDAGLIVNTATGNSDETASRIDQVTVPIDQFPEIETVKTLLTDVSGGVFAGDLLTYEVVVTNTGNITLTNVIASDVLLTPPSNTCPMLAPGDQCVLTGTYAVTQNDIDLGFITNTGIGDSDETDPVPDEITTPLPAAPEIETTKSMVSDISGGVSVGDVLVYKVEVENVGGITLHNVIVTDDKLNPGSTSCATLLPGNICTLTGTYTVTQDDLDAGQIVNEGIGDTDETDPESDILTTPLPQEPEITTVKTMVTDISGGVSVGDEITYQVAVTNTGNITLHNVNVTDDKLTPGSTSCATLAPGLGCTLTGTYTVTQADKDAGQIVNTGIGDSDETDPEPDEITTPLDQNPEIETVKTLLTDISGGVDVGDVLTYQVVVTNVGDITLNNVIVADDKINPDETTCATLAPGSACTLTGTYVVTQADKDAAEIINEGIGDSDETDPVSEEITTPIDQNPGIETVKTLLTDISAGVDVGDDITYQIVVTNTGDITLNNVTVFDAMLTPSLNSCPTLAPNQTCVLQGIYTVTQADKDAGFILNTGIGDSDETDPVPDELDTPLDQNPEIATTKVLDTDVSGGIDVGDVLTYTVTVQNVGDITLNNVSVTDVKLTPNNTICPELLVGESCVLTGTYTVTQADKDAGFILNTGIGDSEETDPLPDELNTPVPQNPSLVTSKTLDTDISGGLSAGDILTYTIVATNDGDITLTNVTVTDPMISPSSKGCPELLPGESCVLSGTYVVTQADIQAGQIVNTGTGDSNETPPDPDELTTPLPQVTDFDITKQLLTDVSGGISVDDNLTYQVVVTNTGNMILNNVVVSDPMLTPASTSCATLVPGATCVLNGTYQVVQDDIDAGEIVNIATGDADETEPKTDQLITPINNINPDIAIEKNMVTDISGGVNIGDELEYEVVVTNTGNITLNNVFVADPMLTPNQAFCATVAPGATCTLTGVYALTLEDLNAGFVDNTATGNSDQAGPVEDQLTTTLEQEPDITTVKTMITDISGGLQAGDDLTYQVEVTNTGNITIHNVTVTDLMLNPGFAGCAILDPGETCTLTGNYTVTLADLDAGSITNTGIGDSDETDPEEEEITTPLPQDPQIEIVKTLLTDVSTGVDVGDEITYQVDVTNTGNITLNNVEVSDPMLTPNTNNCPSLEPDETCTLTGIYTIKQSDLDAGEIVNTATGDSDETDEETDQITTTLPVGPDIQTVKTLLTDVSGGISVGDQLIYQILVTNTGNVTLTNVTISDPMLTPDFASCASVPPGGVCTLTGSYIVTQEDKDAGIILNTGIGDSDQTEPESDQLETPVDQNPETTTVKTLITDVSGGISVGDILTYQVEVTNSGDITLHNVSVTDIKLAPNNEVCAELAPGGACVLTGTYEVTQDDKDAGFILNTGIGDSDETEPDADVVNTPINQDPQLETVKTLLTDISGGVFAGDVLTYQIDVTNIGDITLTDVIVSDPMISPNQSACPVLLIGETCTLTGTYTITQADIQAGSVSNTATGDSDETEPVTDDLTTPLIQVFLIDIEKQLLTDVSGGLSVGDILEYEVVVTNDGNMILNNVVVNDPMLTPASSGCPTLVPGASCTLSGTHEVTQADMDAGEIVNTATGDSDETEEVSDQVVTPINNQEPEFAIVKTLLTDISGGVFAGDELTYEVVVTNTGNITLTNVLVEDDKITPASTGCLSVAPGENCTLTGVYTLTQDDIEAGFILNTGTGNTDQVGPESDELNTPLEQNPEITTSKTLVTDISAGVFVGDELTYTVEVENTGNMILTNVTVSDNKITPNSTICAVLNPGEICTLTGTYTITQNDLNAGVVENTGTGDSDQTEPDTDDVITPVFSGPEIVAVDDAGDPVNGYDGGVSYADVLVNDLLGDDPVDPAEVTLVQISTTNPGVTLDEATGEVTVAPGTPAGDYELVYEICEIANPTNCDQATVTVPVTAAEIVANDDTGDPINGFEGGVTVVDVLVNDELNGSPVNPAEITLVQISSEDPGITLDPLTGGVNVAPGTPAGTYELVYEICEILNPDNCDQATVTVEVTAPEIVANDDNGGPVNGYEGGVAVPDVLVNDLLNGDPVDPTDITLTEISSEDPGVTLDPLTGEVNVAPGTPAGTYQLVYEICEIVNPANCDQATVTVNVSAAEIIANDDNGIIINSFTGGISVADVLVNDLLNGGPVIPAEITLSEISSTHTGVTLDPLTGAVTVAPGTPAGNYELVYEICEVINPANCDQATVFVPVEAPEIIANNDNGTAVNGYNGGVSLVDVLTNDLLNGDLVDPADITLVEISSEHPGVTLDPVTGAVNVAPGTPEGIYELVYEICEIVNPTNCDQATVTVPVEAPEIDAIDDIGTPLNGFAGGVAVPDVLVNDLLNGELVNPDEITLVEISATHPGITLDPITGAINVAAGTPAGNYELVYEICEILNPANCDQAIVFVEVLFSTIVANDDLGDPVNGYVGGSSLPNVLVNDELNGLPVDITDVNIIQNSTTISSVVLNELTGEVNVGQGTPAGIYEIVYEICEILNPDNCDIATVTVPVVAAEIIANDDAGDPVNGFEGGTSFNNVLTNDLLNGVQVDPTEITLTEISSTNPGITLDPVSGNVNVAPGTPAGSYELVYEVCEILNPDNCDQATVTVPVTAPEIIANDDNGGPVNGYDGGTALADVLVNDLLNGEFVDPADVTLEQISTEDPGIVLNPATGEVTVAPGTPAGTYELVYEICEVINPDNCDQAVVTVEVVATEIIANDDFGGPVNGYEGGVGVTDVLVNDLLNGSAINPAEITLAQISTEDPGITLNPLTGEVTVAAGTAAGTYELVYEICEVLNPANCDQAIVTIEVVAPEIIANDDAGNTVNGAAGGVSFDDVLVNDILNGDPVDPADITLTEISSTNPGVSLDPLTGEVVVAPGTPAGNYELVYEICEILNPTNCDQATVTVPVFVEPVLNFCFNEEEAVNGNTLSFCSTEEIAFTLCEIVEGQAPFSICWEVEGVPDCELIVNLGDTLFIDFFDPGTYNVLITSITDDMGTSVLDLSSYEFTFEVVTGPEAFAGPDALVCQNLNHSLSAATATNFSALQWTGGDGNFIPSATVLNPIYVPGSQDALNGSVEICLTALPQNPCTVEFTDCLNLTVQPNATADAGADISVCATDGFVDLNGVVENGNPVWEAAVFTGGFFEDANMAATKYFFSAQDIQLGTIELCLTSIANPPCFIPDTDCVNVTITQSPDANAGLDKTICEGDDALLDDATAANAESVLWATDGDGIFADPTDLNTTYTPGPDDILAGGAQLCLTASPLTGCSEVSINCLNLVIFNAPTADLGPDRELLCDDYDVDNGQWLPVNFNNIISGDYESIQWSTDGDGTFDDPNAESPNYYLGLSDIWDGDVEICINIQAAGDCQFNVTQCVTVYVPQQLIYFHKNGWWGISSYLETDLPSVPEVMDPLVLIPGSQHLVNMVDKTGKYFWPEPVPPQATLGDWMPIGYKLKMKNTPACLPIYGDSLVDQTFEITGSFTYLPTLTNVPVEVETLFEGHVDDVLLIFHWATNELWTPAASDFDSIYPGYAYLLVNRIGAGNYTVAYPDFVPDAPHLYPIQVPTKDAWINNSPWEDVQNTALPHIFLFDENALNRLQPGEILGAFSKSGECYGMAEYGNSDAIFKLVAMGADMATKNSKGFDNGNDIQFRIFNPTAGLESEVEFIFDETFPSFDGTFNANSVSMVKDIMKSATSIGEVSGQDYEINLYPNPATDMLNIVSNESITEITITNSVGQMVYREQTGNISTTVNVSGLNKGLYFVTVQHESDRVTIKRVTIQ